jgi:hypothetical protein
MTFHHLAAADTRETREGWPLQTIEMEVNWWGLKEYK